MLTKWRHARTSFEHTPGTAGITNKRFQDVRNSLSGEIAISFVKPLARNDQFYIERGNSSKNNGKRRRKSTKNRVEGTVSVDDLEPVLCLTSSHRVAIVGNLSSNSGDSLLESKFRNYVSRPGKSTSFHLANNPNSFEGVVSCGAQYDPTSNLIYAIRNGGSELAIWTAASSSIIQGPDQPPCDSVGDGASETANHVTKKRKESGISPSFDKVISQRLLFPEGKTARTLTPLCISTSSPGEENRLLAIGASGCCEDGSVWIAICRDIHDESPFKVLIVDGSSMAETGPNGASSTIKANKRKSTGGRAKKKLDDAAKNWILLDSRAVGVVGNGNDKYAGLLNVNVQSVVFSRDEGMVILRHHQVSVYAEGGEELYNIQQSKKQTVFKVSSRDDINVNLNNLGNSLCIVCKNVEGNWTLSTLELSPIDGTFANCLSSFVLSRESEGEEKLFSLGSLGQNIYAILLKEESKASDPVSQFTLRVVDVQRKIELFTQSWFEGDSQHDRSIANDTALTKMMRGKHCRAMLTNELDGSLALLTTSTDNSGSIGIAFSTISSMEIGSKKEVISKASSLASALRAVASAKPSLTRDSMTANLSSCHPSAFTLSSDHLAYHKYLDVAVEKACKNLNEAAKSLLDLISDYGAVNKKLISNGESRKDADAEMSTLHPQHWVDAFFDGMATIQESPGNILIGTSLLTNGVKNGVKSESKRHKNRNIKELPKRYIAVAFRGTISILLSIHKSAKYSMGDDKMKLDAIHQEALFVLLKTLQSERLSSRADFDFDLPNGENVLLQVLRLSSSVVACKDGLALVPSKTRAKEQRMIGALDIVDAMLCHVRDLPEHVLVCMIQCLMRSVCVDDVVYYYSKDLEAPHSHRPSGGSRTTHKFLGLIADARIDISDDLRTHIATKLLAKALLTFTSKIVMYSKCNHSLLSKSLQEIISPSEVETVLVTLSKLIKYGDGSDCTLRNEGSYRNSCRQSLFPRVIDWISALTDAHMHNILKISDQGGLVIDRIQADIRSALIQTETANKLKDIADCTVAYLSERPKQSSVLTKKWNSSELTIGAYSIEKLTF